MKTGILAQTHNVMDASRAVERLLTRNRALSPDLRPHRHRHGQTPGQPDKHHFWSRLNSVKAETSALTAHTGSTAAHAATAITSTALSGYATVEAALARLEAHKSDVHHTHLAEEVYVNAGQDVGHAIVEVADNLNAHKNSAAAHADTNVTSAVFAGYDRVSSALQYLKNLVDTKASQADLEALQTLTNFLNPDLATVTVNVTVRATADGIICTTTTTPRIFVWGVEYQIKRNGTLIFNAAVGNAPSFAYAYAFLNGDSVEVTATISTGVSAHKASVPVTITWHNPSPNQIVSLDFEAAGTTKVITEADIQTLLGWTAAAGQSVNKVLAITALISSDKKTYSPHTGGFDIATVTDSSVEHLDKITLKNLTDKLNYSVQLTVTQINTKG